MCNTLVSDYLSFVSLILNLVSCKISCNNRIDGYFESSSLELHHFHSPLFEGHRAAARRSVSIRAVLDGFGSKGQ